MPTATSSATINRPASADRNSGIVRATMARRSVWRPRSMPPNPSARTTSDRGMNAISLFFLVSVAIGGIAWVFIYPLLSGEKKAEKRKESVARSTPAVRAAAVVARNTRSRREQVEGSLKELEAKQAKSPPLSARISQAGLSWSTNQFILISAGLGFAGFVIFFAMDAALWAALAAGFAAGFGLPR